MTGDPVCRFSAYVIEHSIVPTAFTMGGTPVNKGVRVTVQKRGSGDTISFDVNSDFEPPPLRSKVVVTIAPSTDDD